MILNLNYKFFPFNLTDDLSLESHVLVVPFRLTVELFTVHKILLSTL